MRRLTINNIGPINHVELDLKRINVIMGPQSSGKSCILKIACFCAWAEKRIELEQGQNGFADFGYVEKNLVIYHKLHGFIKPGSFFSYQTDQLSFTCDFDKRLFQLELNDNGRWNYVRSRVAYIPAERNLVAVIPNWFDVRMENTNLLSFVSDWNLTRQLFAKNTELPVLDLGINYYYDQEKKTDQIRLDDGQVLDFAVASSGIQSVVPLWTYLDFLFHKQYTTPLYSKVSQDAECEDILLHIYQKKYQDGMQERIGENQPYIGKIGMGKLPFANETEYHECKALLDAFTQTSYSDIYLEEPEQNLFPTTQVELVYSLLCNSAEHNDHLFIATHSPYILYALNNCMLGGLVKDNMDEDCADFQDFSDSWIDPQEVAVWELRNGMLSTQTGSKLLTIQDKSGLIRSNYFDRVMKNVMTDFRNLQSFYQS